MADAGRVAVEQRQRVAWVTLDRPRVLNALDAPMLRELVDALRTLDRSAEVGAVVVTGEGRAYSAGADVHAMARMSPTEFRAFVEEIQALTRLLRAVETPVIAAIGGAAVGAAAEMACAVDFCLASSDATFAFPEVRLGIVVTGGASHLLPRIVGQRWATRLLLTGEPVSATTAQQIGLVDEVVQPEQLLGRAQALAEAMADNDRNAMRATKRLLQRAGESSLEASLADEVEVILSCVTEGAGRQGLQAFADRKSARKAVTA